MKTPKQKTRSSIALANNAYPATVTRLISGERKTYNIPLAVEVAKLTGKKPIDFLSVHIAELALQINPELGKRLKKST